MSLEKKERKRAKREHKAKERLLRKDWRESFKDLFEVLALFIATHPWKVCIITFLFNGVLGFGMLNLPWSKLLNNDIEDLYVPKGNPTQKNTELLLELFPDRSAHSFYPHQHVKQPLFAEIMLWKHDKENIINESLYDQMDHIVTYIKNISTFTVNGGYAKYPDVCARRNGNCVIQGEEIVQQIQNNSAGTIPLSNLYTKGPDHYESSLDNLADYVVDNTTLQMAKYIKIRFHLRQDSDVMFKDAKLWRDHFVTYMKKFIKKQYPQDLHMTFAHSGSFYEELGNDTFLDIPYFSFVFTIFLTYLGVVISGGNVISKRVNIGRIGIVVTPLSVLGAWGILMGCGVEFTNTIGVIPLLIQCHQIINALITLSHVSDVNYVNDAHKRVAYAVRSSALPITMTTLCHMVPFCVCIASNYYVTYLVSVYFVTTMAFNYFNHFIFFTACLALHEHRIDSGLHWCCWTKLTPRQELIDEGRNCCIVCCCYKGDKPETREDTESKPERVTRKLMSRFILTSSMKFITCLVFLAYLIVSIWGVAQYDFNSVQVNKVLPKSYYSNWDKYWAREFDNTTIIQFISIHPYGYTHNKTIVNDFQKSIASKPFLQTNSLHSWYDTYSVSDIKNYSSEDAFLQSVSKTFITENPVYGYDLVVDKIRPRVIASRFYMKTKDVPSTKDMIKLKANLYAMVDEVNEYISDQMEDFEDEYEGDPFTWKVEDDQHFLVHCPDFRATDWYMLPLWEILIFNGVQLAILFTISMVLNPSLALAVQIPFWYVTMMSGIFGISHFMGVYLTPVPMIVYMMAACYCTEVIAHTYYAFMSATGVTRAARMNAVLSTISQCIFHTIFGQFLGLLVLIVDESYVFVTVFQLTITTTASCVLHAIFFIPTALSFIGPGDDKIPSESMDKFELSTVQHNTGDARHRNTNVTTHSGTTHNGTTHNGTNGHTNEAYQQL